MWDPVDDETKLLARELFLPEDREKAPAKLTREQTVAYLTGTRPFLPDQAPLRTKDGQVINWSPR
jgi:hypothetical protein